MSTIVSKKLTKYVSFCALFRLSNNTALSKKAIFRWLCFPQVVHKQTLVRWKIEHYSMASCLGNIHTKNY